MKKHLNKISFKDFKLYEGSRNSSIYKHYYYKDLSWDISLKYYGKFPDPNQKERWKLEVWTRNYNRVLNINFEEEASSPDNLIETFNNSRELIYKMYERNF